MSSEFLSLFIGVNKPCSLSSSFFFFFFLGGGGGGGALFLGVKRFLSNSILTSCQPINSV